jgi:ATP/maltotriose-dependent transcriptional regulator MalT
MSGFNRFYNFSLRSSSLNIGERCWFAHFKVDGDFSRLFPFIQSMVNEVVHYEFPLSGREAEVLRLITEGFTNKEIAQILKVSHNTIKSHVVHIFNKLGVNDRTQATVWAAQNELI